MATRAAGHKPIFADPKMDLPFKKVFGTQERKGLLIELLNALLRLPEHARIVDVEYLSPEQLPPHDGLKLSILDVKCTDVAGTRYVVEMQVFPVDGFEKRVVLNAAKAYVEQLESGDDYVALSDVIAVTICNFRLFGDKVKMLSRWRMREEESGETGLSQIQYVFLELPKYETRKRPRTVVEKWAYYFREADKLREVPQELQEMPFMQALEAIRRVNFSEQEWTEYEREKMAEQDHRGGLSLARREGHEEGIRQGLRQGRAEGKREGRAEGLRESLLILLEARGLGPSEQVRARIQAEQDPATLARWLSRCATARSADEVVA
jgi:predicted transposase/invertase (TIGR01784 family)